MNEKIQDELEDDLREEYDLSQLKNPVRGKYYQQYREGHSVTIHHEDGTKTVEHFPAQNDVIILDPPAFAKSRDSKHTWRFRFTSDKNINSAQLAHANGHVDTDFGRINALTNKLSRAVEA